MRAVRIHASGGPEVLKLEDVPACEPGTGEVRVRLEAAALNHLDIWVRVGNVGVSLPRTLGSEGAGIVDRLGPRTQGFQEGDAVVVTPWLYPPLVPRPNLTAQIVGVARDGCYADTVVVPAQALRRLPQGMSMVEAAAFPLVMGTAYRMLVSRAVLQPGETVLITGATGGVGTAALQIAHACGAQVIAATRSAAKSARLKELGAHYVVDSSDKLADQVRAITDGQGVDVLAEQVGGAVWEGALATVKPGGRVTFCGATSGAQVALNLQVVYRRELSLLGVFGTLQEALDRVWTLVEKGALQPVIDRTLPLEEAAEAHRLMERSAHFGKLVLTM